MKTKINNELIRSFGYRYDLSNIPDDESLSIKEWVIKYKDKLRLKKDVIWVICRNEFISDKDLRLFAVWCAREVFKLVKNIDQKSIDAVNIAEKYANGNATYDELSAAHLAAESAEWSDAWSIARESAFPDEWKWSAAEIAARSSAKEFVISTFCIGGIKESEVWSAQIKKLLTYFK